MAQSKQKIIDELRLELDGLRKLRAEDHQRAEAQSRDEHIERLREGSGVNYFREQANAEWVALEQQLRDARNEVARLTEKLRIIHLVINTNFELPEEVEVDEIPYSEPGETE